MSAPSSRSEYLALAELVDLFEYKVDDLQAGRTPKGGLRSIRELRRALADTQLPAPLLRRAVQAEKAYRQHLHAPPTRPPAPAPRLNQPWQAPVTQNSAEAQAWHQLHLLLWHSNLMKEMHEEAQRLRSEPRLPTLRLLYAVTENAERAERGNQVLFPVPPANDPLVTLDDAAVVRQLTDTLGTMLFTVAGQQRVWQALEALRLEPFPVNPEDDLLLSRLEALEEWGGTRSTFWGRVREGLDPMERPVLRAAATRIETWLGQRLPQMPQVLAGAVPPHSILNAQEAPSALSAPDDSDLLCIHMGGPQHLAQWQGLRLSWRSLGPNWQLLVQDEQLLQNRTEGQTTGQTALLRPSLPLSERKLSLSVGSHNVQLFFHGDYVLLHYRNFKQSLERLGHLAAIGRGVALLLDPAEAYGHMRLARAFAQRLRGGPIHSVADPSHYATLSAAERQQSARRSLETLTQLLPRTTPSDAEQAIRSAQLALQLPPLYAVTVHQAAHQAAFSPETMREVGDSDGGPTFLNPNGIFVWTRLEGTSLDLRLPGDRLLSLKLDYKDDLVAHLPGHVPVLVTDLRVLTLHDLTVIVVRDGLNVAVCATSLQSELGLG